LTQFFPKYQKLKWFSKPPIKILETAESREIAIFQFKESVNIFKDGIVCEGHDKNSFWNERIGWNEKISYTYEIIDALLRLVKDDSLMMAAYYVRKIPVGIMAISINRRVWCSQLEFLVTSPGSEAIGSTLIEFYANVHAQQLDADSRMFVVPAGDQIGGYKQNLEGFYAHHGFHESGGASDIRLRLSGSSLWAQDDENNWHLKSKIGKLSLG